MKKLTPLQKNLFLKVDESIADLAWSISQGKAPDWPTYQSMVGELRGLEKAKEAVLERIKKYEQGDDED